MTRYTCCRSSGYLFVEENFSPQSLSKKTTSLLLSGGPISPPNATVTQSSLYSLENWPPAERHAAVFLSLSALFQLMSKVADNNVKHSFSSHNICLSRVLLLVCRRNGGAEWALFFFLCLVWVKNAVVRMKCVAADCWVSCEGQLMPLSWWLQRLIEKNTLSIWPLGRKNSKCIWVWLHTFTLPMNLAHGLNFKYVGSDLKKIRSFCCQFSQVAIARGFLLVSGWY